MISSVDVRLFMKSSSINDGSSARRWAGGASTAEQRRHLRSGIDFAVAPEEASDPSGHTRAFCGGARRAGVDARLFARDLRASCGFWRHWGGGDLPDAFAAAVTPAPPVTLAIAPGRGDGLQELVGANPETKRFRFEREGRAQKSGAERGYLGKGSLSADVRRRRCRARARCRSG
jgi:hypothetical protein